MEEKEAIDALVAHDGISHADVIHVLESSSGRVLHFSRSGVIVRHDCGTVFVVPFEPDGFERMIPFLPEAKLFDVHSPVVPSYLVERGGKYDEGTYTYVYEGPFLDEGPYGHEKLSVDDFPVVREHYHAISSDDVIMDYLRRGRIFGIWQERELLGFAGFHEEGSMGLLEVFPRYRHCGVGLHAESFLINEAMRRGQVPFCNVYFSNKASMALQEKLGLARGRIPSHWVEMQ